MPEAAKLVFRGTPLTLALRGLLWAIPAGLILNMILLGLPAWGLLVVFGGAVATFGLITGAGLYFWDRLGWDDENETLLRAGRRPIPVAEIAGLHRIEQGAATRIAVDLRRGGQRTAALFLSKKTADLFEQSFRERLEVPVLRRRRNEWLAVAVLIASVAILAVGAHVWLASSYPLAQASCASVPAEQTRSENPYSAYGFSFSLPANYEPIAAASRSAVGYSDDATGTRVFAHAPEWAGPPHSTAAPTGGQRRMLRAMGLGTWTSVATWIHCNRLGLLPRVVKALLIGTNGFGPGTTMQIERVRGPNPSLFRLRQDARGIVAELTIERNRADLGWFVITGRDAAEVAAAAAVLRATARPASESAP